MSFVPGSHKQQLVAHTDTFDENNLLSRGQEIAVDVDEAAGVAAQLQTGQASIAPRSLVSFLRTEHHRRSTNRHGNPLYQTLHETTHR